MKLDGEAVKVANVKWSEIVMESIVQERVVDREIVWFWLWLLGSKWIFGMSC